MVSCCRLLLCGGGGVVLVLVHSQFAVGAAWAGRGVRGYRNYVILSMFLIIGNYLFRCNPFAESKKTIFRRRSKS